MKNKNFYSAFENKYRGSRDLIKDRISVYLPFILPLKEIYPDVRALDIGCGRGEWLELLKDNGIDAQGIDVDEGMLKACHAHSLNVIEGDGIAYLQEQPDNSMILISAFHVVEHISFENLQMLVKESMRVLKPGGLLILETPNPENIKVATENFYLDPTHIKPIPSQLLLFLSEYYKFLRTKVVGLQEDRSLLDQEKITLMNILSDVSPDYAIIAQKKADEEILKQFDEVFTQDFGLSLNSLSEKFENRLQEIEHITNQVKAYKEKIKNTRLWKIYSFFRKMVK